MREDQFILQIGSAERIDHGLGNKFQKMLGEVHANKGAENDRAGGVNEAGA